MSDFILFWLAKPLAEILMLLAFIVLALVAVAIAYLPQAIRQARCKHDGRVNETQACDAICSQCLKNLGFIGTWRARQKQGK